MAIRILFKIIRWIFHSWNLHRPNTNHSQPELFQESSSAFLVIDTSLMGAAQNALTWNVADILYGHEGAKHSFSHIIGNWLPMQWHKRLYCLLTICASHLTVVQNWQQKNHWVVQVHHEQLYIVSKRICGADSHSGSNYLRPELQTRRKAPSAL